MNYETYSSPAVVQNLKVRRESTHVYGAPQARLHHRPVPGVFMTETRNHRLAGNTGDYDLDFYIEYTRLSQRVGRRIETVYMAFVHQTSLDLVALSLGRKRYVTQSHVLRKTNMRDLLKSVDTLVRGERNVHAGEYLASDILKTMQKRNRVSATVYDQLMAQSVRANHA